MYSIVVIIHVLSATIWTGGHIVLATAILPAIIKNKDINGLLSFEKKYERIGMPALIIQVISGLYLSYSLLPDISLWFTFSNHVSSHILLKLIFLIITIAFAANANFRLIPNLDKENNFKIFTYHILAVTFLSVLFLIVGLSFRLQLF